MPRLHVIQINVTDMDLAIDFYCTRLGFAIRSRDHYPELVKLEHDQIPLVLYRVKQLITPAQVDTSPYSLVLDMAVESLGQEIEALRQRGVEVLQVAPQDSLAGMYASIRDPFGTTLHIVTSR